MKLINLKGNDSIAAVAKVMHDEDDVESVEQAENTQPTNDGTTVDNNTDNNNNE
ncbi:DNA gyrase subunit A [Jejuia pallidilutea]|uniref:DNA gyrase subunit A n=1 Tax=Jejuia pallidilutea TaxID=504487 RepID=A0A090VRC9_9FLAO|nr:DNA gyrase subunit A [Jejuia pallidilutea]